jgi:hypothetical protein
MDGWMDTPTAVWWLYDCNISLIDCISNDYVTCLLYYRCCVCVCFSLPKKENLVVFPQDSNNTLKGEPFRNIFSSSQHLTELGSGKFLLV